MDEHVARHPRDPSVVRVRVDVAQVSKLHRLIPMLYLTVRGAVTWECARLAHRLGTGHTSAWHSWVKTSSRCYAPNVNDHALGSLTVTPHHQEAISKRSSGQISCTISFAVGHVGDSFDTLIFFATDDLNTSDARLHPDPAGSCGSDYRIQITDHCIPIADTGMVATFSSPHSPLSL